VLCSDATCEMLLDSLRLATWGKILSPPMQYQLDSFGKENSYVHFLKYSLLRVVFYCSYDPTHINRFSAKKRQVNFFSRVFVLFGSIFILFNCRTRMKMPLKSKPQKHSRITSISTLVVITIIILSSVRMQRRNFSRVKRMKSEILDDEHPQTQSGSDAFSRITFPHACFKISFSST
jgi:hypothetical protein